MDLEKLVLDYVVNVTFKSNNRTIFIDENFKSFLLELTPASTSCVLQEPIEVEGNSISECAKEAICVMDKLIHERNKNKLDSITSKMCFGEGEKVTPDEIEFLYSSLKI